MRMILSHARVGWLASVRIAEGIMIFEQEVEKKTCWHQACNFIVKRKRESLQCKSVHQLRISENSQIVFRLNVCSIYS